MPRDDICGFSWCSSCHPEERPASFVEGSGCPAICWWAKAPWCARLGQTWRLQLAMWLCFSWGCKGTLNIQYESMTAWNVLLESNKSSTKSTSNQETVSQKQVAMMVHFGVSCYVLSCFWDALPQAKEPTWRRRDFDVFVVGKWVAPTNEG